MGVHHGLGGGDTVSPFLFLLCVLDILREGDSRNYDTWLC